MTVEKSPSPGARLRASYANRCIAMPGVFNSLVAMMAERAGFEGMYLSGAALSAASGLPDIGLLSMSEFVEQVRVITAASSLPLLVDADTGFGGPLNAERTVRELERAGAAGIQIEDQQIPKRCGHLSGKFLVSAEEMEQKIRAAVSARLDTEFVIVARTDARGVEGFEAAVGRAHRYLEAGADVIFPEALPKRRSCRFPPSHRGTAVGEHDRVRPGPSAERRGAERARLPHRPVSGDGVPDSHEGGGAGARRDPTLRLTRGNPRFDAVQSRALRSTRIRGYEERDEAWFRKSSGGDDDGS